MFAPPRVHVITKQNFRSTFRIRTRAWPRGKILIKNKGRRTTRLAFLINYDYPNDTCEFIELRCYGRSYNTIKTEAFTQIDEFSEQHVIKPDPGLEECMEQARENGLPDISVSAIQGKFLMLQAKMMKAKRILEIGTLAGYSSIWYVIY